MKGCQRPDVDTNYQSFLSNTSCGTQATAILVCTGGGGLDAWLQVFGNFFKLCQ